MPTMTLQIYFEANYEGLFGACCAIPMSNCVKPFLLVVHHTISHGFSRIAPKYSVLMA